MIDPKRKIPYNYTSADDDQIIHHLFGSDILSAVRSLDGKEGTGRSSRLLNRFMGDMFIIERNAFLFQELVEHPLLRKKLFSEFEADLGIIEHSARHDEVRAVLESCRKTLADLKERISTITSEQGKIQRRLGSVIGRKNIYFDAFNITSHATDATDWRRYAPLAVLRPDKAEDVPALVKKIIKLDYNIIPRGAGTGLTGGATPLTQNCVMINTEKLNAISCVKMNENPEGQSFASMALEAGVITQDAKDAAHRQGYIFATDPTSAWACTIGGNLAENAGGKTAVLYGTAIDNVLSYDIVTPAGEELHVARRNHPARKILPDDEIIFDITDFKGQAVDTIHLTGEDIRKKGLGKDVTNKTLGGLPGIQKEGCDGIITRAEFILYPEFAFKKTCCIEFFGNDMTEAGQVITTVCDRFANTDPALMALEHFDEEYIRAIGYKTKQSVGDRLKAVLLIDMVSNDEAALSQGMAALESILEPFDKTGFTVAADAAEAARFWEDRKRLGAIAKHTNAFKLNEDIVLPIKSLADFVRFVDQANLEEKKYNQLRVIQEITDYLGTAIPLSDPQWLKKKIGRIKDLAYNTRKKLDMASRDALERAIHSKNFYNETVENLRGYSLLLENVEAIYKTVSSRLIVIATHMHAGDGNVHVNIPVLSNDREMMERAEQAADRVMEKTVELNGVVSGEHGIGVTKFKYLDPEQVKAFTAYRAKVDPDGRMNPKKLEEDNILAKVFTPSFNLLELEARILKHGSLSDLAMKIANCVRCGKCKPECPVFFPAENMFFHPRNKNLAIGALIEALLYIAQRTQNTRFKVLKGLEEIADHCTICHRCFKKCPVNIDSGVISVKERDILKKMGFKHTPVPTKLSLNYLASKGSFKNVVFRAGLLTAGGMAQRTAHKTAKPLGLIPKVKKTRTYQLLKSPVAKASASSLRAWLPGTERNQVIVLNPEEKLKGTVFYFPGCGSERMFSSISRAAIFILLSRGYRVILPPPFLCCGYPLKVNAKTEEFNRVCLETIIILTQVRDMFNDLSFAACIVSCGTCMESLDDLGARDVFDCEIQDVAGFVLEDGLILENDYNNDPDVLYHAPCHDSLKDRAVDLLAGAGIEAKAVPYCCSEAGTLALSRPDISNAMLARKADAIAQTCGGKIGKNPKRTMLTNCPSCIQGLGRQKGIKPVHMAQALAEMTGGKDWEKRFKALVKNPEIVTF